MLFLVLAWYLTLVSIVLGELRIPLLAVHKPKVRDFSGEHALVSLTEGSQGASAKTFEWINPEEKIARLKAIEIFKISENNIRLSPGPTTWSQITDLLAKWMVILPENRDLVHLVQTVPTHNESLERLVKATRGVVRWFYEAVDLWDEGSPLDKTVLLALETLQGDNLTALERLWVLSLSRLLQSYLPRGDLKPIRLDPNMGPVCRGALELFLTEGIDLTHAMDDKIEVVPASEGQYISPFNSKKLENTGQLIWTPSKALERVELIVKIKNHFEDFEKDNPTANFMKIYDSLLQTKSKSIKREFVWLTLRCMQHMVVETTPKKEKECIFHILDHISTFSQESRKYIQEHVAQKDNFGEIYQSMSNKFRYQAELRPRVKKYFAGEDIDPYIGNLLLPFIGLTPVSLDHIKHVITSLHLQQYALSHGQEELYGLDLEKAHKYNEDHHFVLDTLHIASPYVEGSKELLDSKSEAHSKSLELNLGLSLNLPMENSNHLSLAIKDKNYDPCAICTEEFFQGQRVIQLTCFHSHKLHAQCMDVSS
ncbi:uncharacterized protein MELLADRAFT_58990 [Melampsora larici-populina 98AG31]|uniref:RING-type domain-containing protein n=1 Tax=Melampsora larici-populina (strain 98AG31 / pathotype 3-4-7) TaxID=747676 RepID=F4R6N6_MELLP|nr:uncharacterized protein MELLADRAFT_58990 [Melampsora larici-populina 98AG31]EGG11909.1 hypothetical protein MELLADRAFT_58990 [Melampsora larici-populina 98AG31]